MNNSSSNRDEIVLTQSGDIFNPVQIDTLLTVLNFSCCLIGIPLNLSIAVTIIRLRRLHRKPRNIFLLGIIFSNLSFFVPAVIKLIYSSFYSSESLCQIYVALVGVPQGLLSLNMLLALIDRYVAINHPLLHRKKMTVRLASVIVLLSSTLIVFLLKFIYIFDLAPLRCEVWLVHAKKILIILAIMFASSVTLNFIVYRQTKNHLSESQCYAPSTNDDFQIQNVNIIFDVDGNVIDSLELVAVGNDNNGVPNDYTIPMTPMSIHVNREKLGQMEMEATRTLIIGVTSLTVTALPPTIFVSIFLACRLMSQSNCSQMNWMAPYMIELGLVNIVCSPLIFLLRNKELKAALTCQ
jgi:hypothetical protein